MQVTQVLTGQLDQRVREGPRLAGQIYGKTVGLPLMAAGQPARQGRQRETGQAGNQQAAADKLGISARTIRNKLRKYREDGMMD